MKSKKLKFKKLSIAKLNQSNEIFGGAVYIPDSTMCNTKYTHRSSLLCLTTN